MKIEDFESSGSFFDDKNFPWGFSRCGNFTIAQAEILGKYGKTLRALEHKEKTPATPEEKQFVAVCRGKREASTLIEITWIKYLSLTTQKDTVSAFGNSNSKPEDDVAVLVGDDLDDDIDD